MTDTAYTPGLKLLTRCHLETQLSSGLIIAMIPSNEELVQSYTISLLPFICRYGSQLSQPSYSNWSIVCKGKKRGGGDEHVHDLNISNDANFLILYIVQHLLVSKLFPNFTLTLFHLLSLIQLIPFSNLFGVRYPLQLLSQLLWLPASSQSNTVSSPAELKLVLRSED